jgi:hypothetical protein
MSKCGLALHVPAQFISVHFRHLPVGDDEPWHFAQHFVQRFRAVFRLRRDARRFRVPVEAPTGYRRHHQRVEQSTWLGKLKHFLGLRNSHASHGTDAFVHEATESKYEPPWSAAVVEHLPNLTCKIGLLIANESNLGAQCSAHLPSFSGGSKLSIPPQRPQVIRAAIPRSAGSERRLLSRRSQPFKGEGQWRATVHASRAK